MKRLALRLAEIEEPKKLALLTKIVMQIQTRMMLIIEQSVSRKTKTASMPVIKGGDDIEKRLT
jgi:hypothetical protein